jgi:hypothetical protein
MPCFACGGPYHPASGHLFNSETPYCGPCYRYFLSWMKGHIRRKWGGCDFYEEAARCVRIPLEPGTSFYKRTSSSNG